MNAIQISEQFISVSGGQIYLKRWLPNELSQKSPLILFHDSLGCVELWRDFPEKLALKLKCEVIAYDRLGFGRSSFRDELPSICFIKEEAEVYFDEIVRQLDIESYTLFGHSVGGCMALVAAGLNPKKCERVISESAQAFVEDKTRKRISEVSEEFRNPAHFSKLQKYHGDKAQWVLDAWVKVWLSPEFAGWALFNDLSPIESKTLILHGSHDEYGSIMFPEAIGNAIGSSARVEILEDCGHVPHREKPEVILGLVSVFLSNDW